MLRIAARIHAWPPTEATLVAVQQIRALNRVAHNVYYVKSWRKLQAVAEPNRPAVVGTVVETFLSCHQTDNRGSSTQSRQRGCLTLNSEPDVTMITRGSLSAGDSTAHVHRVIKSDKPWFRRGASARRSV
jgi:hypothetical protein